METCGKENGALRFGVRFTVVCDNVSWNTDNKQPCCKGASNGSNASQRFHTSLGNFGLTPPSVTTPHQILMGVLWLRGVYMPANQCLWLITGEGGGRGQRALVPHFSRQPTLCWAPTLADGWYLLRGHGVLQRCAAVPGVAGGVRSGPKRRTYKQQQCTHRWCKHLREYIGACTVMDLGGIRVTNHISRTACPTSTHCQTMEPGAILAVCLRQVPYSAAPWPVAVTDCGVNSPDTGVPPRALCGRQLRPLQPTHQLSMAEGRAVLETQGHPSPLSSDSQPCQPLLSASNRPPTA